MERTDQQGQRPTPKHSHDAATARDVGALYVAAATADHLAHCPGCRNQTAASDTRRAENGASMARRDRLTLGLGNARRTAVNA